MIGNLHLAGLITDNVKKNKNNNNNNNNNDNNCDHVDIGNDIVEDSTPVAKEALVILVVSITGSWKISCGYFFIDELSVAEQTNLVKISLSQESLKINFPHPLGPEQKMNVFLDVCHMLKLTINTLSEGGILIDNSGHKIYWHFITELHKLQDMEGLRLGKKLIKAHIE